MYEETAGIGLQTTKCVQILFRVNIETVTVVDGLPQIENPFIQIFL